jgi:hypothetical protein
MGCGIYFFKFEHVVFASSHSLTNQFDFSLFNFLAKNKLLPVNRKYLLINQTYMAWLITDRCKQWINIICWTAWWCKYHLFNLKKKYSTTHYINDLFLVYFVNKIGKLSEWND